MTKRKLLKVGSPFFALALVLSVVMFAVPTIPAQASPAQTLTLELETITGSEGPFRALTLQAGDEVVQFTRDSVTIPSDDTPALFITVSTISFTVSGSLSGTILMEDNSISVDLPVATAQRLAPPEGQEPLADVDAFGFSVGKFTFDDGSGNTFSGIFASDWDMDDLTVGHQGIVRGYMVSTEEGGDFSGQKLIGILAIKYQEPGFEILGSTITLTHHFAGEITSLGTTEFEGTVTQGTSRPIPTLTDDTLVQFTAGNVALPGDDNTGFSGGGVLGTITGGPLTGTMTSEMNLVDYYSAGFGWVAGKFSIVDGNDTISGVMLVDMEGETGEGYMFALSGGTTTGIYTGKEYFATLSATADGVFTGSAEFMELSGAPVTFPDSNLEAAIREAIGKPAGDIYPSDLEGLTELDASDRDITDLTGLEHCTSLTDLWLCENQISDVSPLENLTSLTYLHLSRNQIGNISPLSGLTSLTELDLDGNYTSDITPLSDLTGLTELDLQGNQISDVSPLEDLTSLTWMHLGENEVSDISPLANLTSLGVLWLGDNQITDINPLTNLTSLTELELGWNQISNISPLENLTSLTWLELPLNQISDISPLSTLTSLTAYLWLEGNQISNISPLSNLTSLAHLDLGVNQISNISPLSNLTSLITLHLDNNQISGISPLENLTSLVFLDLRENQISDISPLENLTNLGVEWEEIDLDLSGNEISDIEPLVNNPGLSDGDTVDLRDNPLSTTSVNVYIPQLVARGVEVLSDEVTFPDSNLEAAIREEIDKPVGPIYTSDLEGLTSLDASGRGITDLTGLEYCTSLTWLDLHENQIGNITPLSNLASLTWLGLGGNQISDITLLSNLTSLIVLGLGGNQISDISPLSNLTSLTRLWLWDNQISDISPLSNLTSLEVLGLWDNQISDISPLENLTSLGVEWEEIDLNLSGNEISDIEALVNNPGLSEGDTIDLTGNPLSSTSVNVYIPQLVARGVEVLSDVAPEALAADFSASPTSGTAPLTVRFTDQSTGGITDWEWDFDNDGKVDSTEQNPSYTYEFAGEYTVSLRVAGPVGEDIRVKSGIIRVKEKAEPKNGGGFDCGCSRVEAKTRSGELLIGWAVVGLCWGGGYYLVTRVNRRRRE